MSLPQGYSIRRFLPGDETELHKLTTEAINQVGPARYSPEQTAAWAARHDNPQRFADRVADGAIIHVAICVQSSPAAYALIEFDRNGDAHLDMLYCHPHHTRKGIAEALLKRAEETARENASSKIYTEASELARPSFERAGYTLVRRRDFMIEHEGRPVPIHNFAMENTLV